MSQSARASIELGRDGMGDATEEDFDRWVAYVTDRIDNVTGIDVDVSARRVSDVQSDYVSGSNETDDTIVREALRELWDCWCEEGAPNS